MRRRILTLFVIVMVFTIGYGVFADLFIYTDSTPTRHDRAILARAERGDAEAQFHMGTFLATGRQGIEPDPVQAGRWFEAAARQGHAPAKYRLGDLYRNGEGVERNLQRAVTLFMEAVRAGDSPAENALGDLYLDGEGVKQSPATALYWYQRAAAAGFAPAQRNLGVMAAKGVAMPQSYATAMRWYRKAAAQGDAPALHNLGILYEFGQGVTADPERAWACYYRASLRSFPPTRSRRDALEAGFSETERQRARELPCLDGSLPD